jgi:hypothetical protein
MVSELGFSDALSLAQTIGIVGTMVLTLYFSKRQIQGLSIDVETKVLNDLGEKVQVQLRDRIYRCASILENRGLMKQKKVRDSGLAVIDWLKSKSVR